MALSENKKQILLKLYEDYRSPSGLSGINMLFKAAKIAHPHITLQEIKHFLAGQNSYTLHKITPRRFTRRKTIASGPKNIITCDLADMSSISSHNDGVRYLLIGLDVFSRYMSVKKLINKNSKTVTEHLELMLDEPAFKGTRKIFCDRGAEFTNNNVKQMYERKKIKFYSTHSQEIKSGLIERHIRTLKTKIYKFLTHTKSQRYIDVLNDLVSAYNSSPHRGLKGLTPLTVHFHLSPRDIRELYFRMYSYRPPQAKQTHTLPVGQTVRVSSTARQNIFHKSHKILNTREIFRIRKTDVKLGVRGYFLEDLLKEEIQGVFYRDELIPTLLPAVFDFEIIKTLKDKKTQKVKHLVEWVGYPSKFNSYINESDIE